MDPPTALSVSRGHIQYGPPPEEILDREQLTYSLDRLSGPQRQVIMLAFYGGHTYTEVAAILGLAVGTVKSRIRAGLTMMRETMHARLTTAAASGQACGNLPDYFR